MDRNKSPWLLMREWRMPGSLVGSGSVTTSNMFLLQYQKSGCVGETMTKGKNKGKDLTSSRQRNGRPADDSADLVLQEENTHITVGRPDGTSHPLCISVVT